METAHAETIGDATLHELGFEETEPGTLPGRTKAAAWGIGTAGVVAFVALALGAIVAVDRAIPYLHYLVLLGAGGTEF